MNFYWEIYSGIVCFCKGFIFPFFSILIPSLYTCPRIPRAKGHVAMSILWPAWELVPQAEQGAGGVETTAALILLPIFIPSITNTEVCSLAVFQEGKSLEFFCLATSVQWKYNSTSTSQLQAVPVSQVAFWGGIVPYHDSVQYLAQPRAQIEVDNKISSNSPTCLSNSFSFTPALSPKNDRSWFEKVARQTNMVFLINFNMKTTLWRV